MECFIYLYIYPSTCLYTYLSIQLPICLSQLSIYKAPFALTNTRHRTHDEMGGMLHIVIYLSTYLPIYLFTNLPDLSMYTLSTHRGTGLMMRCFIYLSIYLWEPFSTQVSIGFKVECLIYLSKLFKYLSRYLSIYLSIQFIYLDVRPLQHSHMHRTHDGMLISLSTYQSIYLIQLSIRPPQHSDGHRILDGMLHLFTYLSVYLCIYLSTYLYTYLPSRWNASSIYLSI